jgi:hypothetical protein
LASSTSAGTRKKTSRAPGVAWWYHALLALLVVSIVWLAHADATWYESLMQEDRLVEWGTVWFFFTAALLGGWRAVRERRPFDALVALFCLFVAGEEFSWGQRLLGFTAPEVFLEHNRQQELTLHNFADVFGQPKWALILALSGYGLLLPALDLHRIGRSLLTRIRATAPPLALAPWFFLAVLLLVWYPLDFTGEWVELVAGMLFGMVVAPNSSVFATLSLNAVVFTALLTWWSGRSIAKPEALACARDEATALSSAFAGQAQLENATGSFHKRVWTAHEERRVDLTVARNALDVVSCGTDDQEGRRRYAVDPWGTAYWIRFTPDPQSLTVYSFGPNRRRDDGGDDIIVSRP